MYTVHPGQIYLVFWENCHLRCYQMHLTLNITGVGHIGPILFEGKLLKKNVKCKMRFLNKLSRQSPCEFFYLEGVPLEHHLMHSLSGQNQVIQKGRSNRPAPVKACQHDEFL